jgi:hypothetical protein
MWQKALENFTGQLGEHLPPLNFLILLLNMLLYFLTISERIPCLRLL